MTLIECIECAGVYDRMDLQGPCPECGSYRWVWPASAAGDDWKERVQLASRLRQHARALREDDINQFYTITVAGELEEAAGILEGGEHGE